MLPVEPRRGATAAAAAAAAAGQVGAWICQSGASAYTDATIDVQVVLQHGTDLVSAAIMTHDMRASLLNKVTRDHSNCMLGWPTVG